MLNIDDLRNEYQRRSLDMHHLHQDPFLQFLAWFEETKQAKALAWNAMALATVSAKGRPSCRTVLLKQIDSKGFCFFTNYESRKSQDLTCHPFACATFYWGEIERQVIIEGDVEKLTRQESENYFASRPRGSQLGAWASHQDQIVNSRAELEEAYEKFEKVFESKSIPMPSYWGGYRLLPIRFEFWQGRPNRLHDRFEYILKENTWQINRLSP